LNLLIINEGLLDVAICCSEESFSDIYDNMATLPNFGACMKSTEELLVSGEIPSQEGLVADPP
jgi:hypothetical protein